MDDNKTYKVGSDIYDIPVSSVDAFLKDNPNAIETQGYTVGKDTFDIPVTETNNFLKDNPTAQLIQKKKASPIDLASKGQTVLSDIVPDSEKASVDSSTQASPSAPTERPEILDKLGLSIDTPPPTGFKEDNIGTRGLEYLSGETRDFAEEKSARLKKQIAITPSTVVNEPDNMVTGSTPGSLIADYIKGKHIERDSPIAETTGEKLLSIPKEAANAFGKFFDDIATVGKAVEGGFAQLFLGKKNADEYMKIKEKGGLALPSAISTHPAQTLSTFLDESTKNWKEMPEGVGWGVGKGLLDIAPDITATLLFPEGKVLNIAPKYGLKIGAFAMEQAARGYAQGIGESNGNFGLQLKMPIVTALEKGATAWMYETMGGLNRTVTNNIVSRLLPNPTTTSEILNKALFEHGMVSLSDGFTFGGLSALDEFLRTGKVTADNVAMGFGTGLAFHAVDGAKLMAAKGLNTILGMPAEGITNFAKSEMSVEDLNKQAEDKINLLETNKSDNPEGDAVMAFMLKRAAQTKAVSEEVLNNKDGLILSVKSSTLDTKTKNLLIDKINEVNADNDPKIQATKDITDKISKIDDELDNISGNNSWDDVRKEVESAPLKERKEELKEEAKKVYGIEPKEQPKGEDGKVKEKPKAVQTEASQKFLDELDKPKEKEVQNAESTGGGTEESSQQTQGLESGQEERLRLRNTSENGVETKQGEEVKPQINPSPTETDPTKLAEPKPLDNFMSDSKNAPEGVKEQIKEYEKPGELQKGWEEAINTIPKKPIGTLPDGRKVFVVSGTDVRDKVYTNWTEGGNDSAYPWMPKGELWIEDVESNRDKIADLLHEAMEQKAMQEKGISYDEAHEKYGLPAERKYRATGEIPTELQDVADKLTNEPVAPLQSENQANNETSASGGGNAQGGGESGSEALNQGENEGERAWTKRILESSGYKDYRNEMKEGLNYEKAPNDLTTKQAQYYIAENGLEKSAKDIQDIKIKMPDRVRVIAAHEIMEAYKKLASEATDPAEKAAYRDKVLDIKRFLDEKTTGMAQGLQALNAIRVNDILTPEMQLIEAKKMVDGMRQKLVDKNKKSIDANDKSMKAINNSVADEVINSKEYQDLKNRVAELEKKVAEQAKVPKDYKKLIKQEQEFRKPKWDALKESFKKPGTALSGSVIPLSAEQISIIADIVGSYAREGVTRAEEILDRFKKDFLANTGQELDDDKAKGMIVEAQKLNEEKEVKQQQADKVDQVVKDHYTKTDDSGRTLKQKLIEDAGLSDADAQKMADKVAKKFNESASPKKKDALNLSERKKKKGLGQKLIDLTNKGAWNDEDFKKAYGDELGWPKLTDENKKEITRLAEIADKAPKGEQKGKAIQALLAYQESQIKGLDYGDIANALWYASALSGPHTHVKKISSELQTIGLETVVDMLYHAKHPSDIPHLFSALLRGWGSGYEKALDVLKTGYNPMNKEETPSVLEMVKGPLGVGKYVHRMFTAVQQFNAGPTREMRATELAINKARARNANEPSKDDWGEAWKILAKTPEQKAQFEQQAQDEGLKGHDYNRRVWELMEQNRPEDIMEDAEKFSLRNTYMGPPEGLLGMFAHTIGKMTTAVSGTVKIPFTNKEYTVYPLKRIVPFTRVLANLGNQMLDYNLIVGGARYLQGSMGMSGMEKYQFSKGYYRKFTPEERAKEGMRVVIGMATMAGIWGLTRLKDKDGDHPFEITANGYGKGDRRNDDLKKLGWQPFSIRVGDRWFSYQHSPLALAIAPLGYFDDFDKYNKKDELTGDKFAMKAVKCYANGMSTIFSAPYIQGLNEFFAAISTNDPNKTGTYFGRLASGMGKSVIYPKLIEQTVQTIDNLDKTPEKTSTAWDAQIFRNIPVARNSYNIRYNVWGDEVGYPTVFGQTKVAHDPFYEYMVKNNINPEAPRQTTPHYDDVKGILRPMTDDEYADFIHKSGQETKQLTQSEVIDKKLPQDEAKKFIENTYTKEKDKYITELFGWGKLRQDHPSDWKLMRDNDALQTPPTSEHLKVGKEKEIIATEDQIPTKELETFRNNAMEYYRSRVMPYLQNQDRVKNDKGKQARNESGVLITDADNNPISKFDYHINELWAKARAKAKEQTEKTLEKEKNTPTKK
jgi:hypothetical protein